MTLSLTTRGFQGSGGGGGVSYRMRAFDTTLVQVVYWTSTLPDDSQYAGPGPLTGLIISKILRMI